VEDVSKKRGMDFRLLHSVAYGCTWYGRWGYFFGRGSFGNTLATWRDAVQTLQSLTLDQLRRELATSSPKEAALIGEYVSVAAALRRPTRGNSNGGGGEYSSTGICAFQCVAFPPVAVPPGCALGWLRSCPRAQLRATREHTKELPESTTTEN